ncbi:hypothetical protein MtrunA17_Chr8g0362421 [Medicago truncatula]|uniref:Uncharacterized protein n=1 Tax=Medicago truncatula TaxID=3880 RepID=A0A072U1Z9_MEDTR|nr:hypothetical protein MTR_8g468700 [Medicago truncatula]RHN41097.1 hypothetical protein MtrunA17_Chr8g0362421 [Medicago truncatula]
MDQVVIFVKMKFDSSFYMDLSVFSCLETFRQTLDQIWTLGSQKWDFGVKNGFSPKQNSSNLSQLAMESWRRVGGAFCVSTRQGE